MISSLLSTFLSTVDPVQPPVVQTVVDATTSLISYGPIGAFAVLLIALVWYMLRNQTKAADRAAEALVASQKQQQEVLAQGLSHIAERINEGSQRGIDVEKEHSNQIKDLARVNENLTNKLFEAIGKCSK